MSSASIPAAQALLEQAHPPSTAAEIYTSRIQHKPLTLFRLPDPLNPSSTPKKHTTVSKPSNSKLLRGDIRSLRRDLRSSAHAARRIADKRKKTSGRTSQTPRPKPLSAKSKRKLNIYEIPPEGKNWELYVGLHSLWCGYMRDVLSLTPRERENRNEENEKGKGKEIAKRKHHERERKKVLTPDIVGPLLASADYHGCLLRVVRSKCVSRVGVEGIVVRDTKFTFEIITRKNEVKVMPKEGTVFRFEVPLKDNTISGGESDGGVGEEGKDKGSEEKNKSVVFELHGQHLRVAAPERANRKFKLHIDSEL